jgi:hypothetical protein
MKFSEVLASLERRGETWATAVPDDWMQGRSVFGGLQTALAVRALRSVVPAEMPLRAVQTTFVGPVEGQVRIGAQVLRAGKNVVHAEARILGEGQTSTIVVGVFGRSRPSRAIAVPPVPPSPPPLAEPIAFRFVPGLSASFIQHYGVRLLAGDLPFTGVPHAPRAHLEIDVDDVGGATEEQLVGIADVIPPLAFAMLSDRAMGSSVTWTLELLRERWDDQPLSRWGVHAAMVAGHAGYTSQSVMVTSPDGAPAALSHQVMMVFG